MSSVIPTWLDEEKIEWKKDPNTQQLIKDWQAIHALLEHLTWKGNTLWYKWRIYWTPNSKLKKKILHESHSTSTVGYLGFLKTYYRV